MFAPKDMRKVHTKEEFDRFVLEELEKDRIKEECNKAILEDLKNARSREDFNKLLPRMMWGNYPEQCSEWMGEYQQQQRTERIRKEEKQKKEEEEESQESGLILRNCEKLREYVMCYKLMNGSKMYFKRSVPQEFYYHETKKADLSIAKALLHFAGEMNNAIYFYTLKTAGEEKDEYHIVGHDGGRTIFAPSITREYTFYKSICPTSDQFTPILREIGQITTFHHVEFAIQQPYFAVDTTHIIEDFEGNQIHLPEFYLLPDREKFFVRGDDIFIVKINSSHCETDIVRRGRFVKISLEDDLALPESFCTKKDEPIYLMCGNVLMVIQEDFQYKTHELDDDYKIVGMEKKKLFFMTDGLSGFIDFETLAFEDKQDDQQIEYSSKFLSDFTVKAIRGEGGYGYVFEAVNKIDNWRYAVKRVAVGKNDLERGCAEVRAMAQLDHPNIVRYNSTWREEPPVGWQRNADAEMFNRIGIPKNRLRFDEDSAFIYIQMQLCDRSLADWLGENQTAYSRVPLLMKVWFKQIVAGVDYIHRSKMIHRDLKPSNILFTADGSLKLCDLGIVTTMMVDREGDQTVEIAVTRTNIGTELYMSPEQCSLISVYSSKTDVFALGLILAELCVVMSTDRKTIFDNYRRGNQCELIADERTGEFIALLTRLAPNDRPTCAEMIKHPFLA